jgi:hypothetical protein
VVAQYLEKAGVWEILDLIAAEFKSDPMSTQCFDAGVVARAIALNREWRDFRAANNVPEEGFPVAVRVYEQIMDVLRVELERPDFVPMQALGGQLRAVLAYLGSAPPERPTILVTLESRIRAALAEMGSGAG